MTSTILRRIAMAAALGIIALNTISGTSAEQFKVRVPDAKEFREGDKWAAHVPVTNEYAGLKKINGAFVYANYSLDDYLNDQKLGTRNFTDLDGALPRFPADHERLFAAPDGTLYAFFNDQWHRIEIGHSFPTILGPLTVTERMTQIQADVMSLELLRRVKMAKAVPSINKTALRPVMTMDGNTPRINSESALPARKTELDGNLRENLQLGKSGEGLQRAPLAVRRISNIDDQHEQHGNADVTAQLSQKSKLAEVAARVAVRAVLVNAARFLILR